MRCVSAGSVLGWCVCGCCISAICVCQYWVGVSEVSPVLDSTAEPATGGGQVEGGAPALQGVWAGLNRNHLDVQQVSQLDKRQFTCQSTHEDVSMNKGQRRG